MEISRSPQPEAEKFELSLTNWNHALNEPDDSSSVSGVRRSKTEIRENLEDLKPKSRLSKFGRALELLIDDSIDEADSKEYHKLSQLTEFDASVRILCLFN